MSVISLLKQSLFSRQLGAALPPKGLSQLHPKVSTAFPADPAILTGQKKVLNVGGNSKAIAIPEYYEGWIHHLLDIDPTGQPDIVCDARALVGLSSTQYDSVYCSHNLEHYYSHDVIKVLTGFHHILKDDGFVDIRVPDMQAVIKHMVANDMDIDDVLYELKGGEPIRIKDVMYGWGREIEESGEDFFGHKTGFSEKSLTSVLTKCGFSNLYVKLAFFEIQVLGFKQPPSQALLEKLNLPSPEAAATAEK